MVKKVGHNKGKTYNTKKKLKITENEQFDFWKSIAMADNDPTISAGDRMKAYEKLCELCGEKSENTAKYIIELRFNDE